MSRRTTPKICTLACSLLVSTAQVAVLALPAVAQNRALPKAGFSNYSGANVNNLPNAGGVHLGDGEDRKLNAPPEVYDPGEKQLGMKLVRWEARHMPIRVWVSQGGKLPEESFSEIQAHRPQEVLQMMMAGHDLTALPQCQGWTPDMTQAAINGIEQWKELQNEGLFSFQFVEDPSQAQVLVFWVDRFVEADGPGGSSVHGNTSATLFDANLVHNVERRDGRPAQGAPVIIELKVNGEPERLQADTAHEFGHALGIKEHSPYRQDIMCVNRQTLVLSPSDKATMRWLYRQPVQYVMLPPVNMPTPVARRPAPAPAPAPVEQEQPVNTGRYKITTNRESPGTTDYDSSTPPPEVVTQRPRQDEPPERPSKKQKKRPDEGASEPRGNTTTTAPRDDFEDVLDEIRGVKKKERKPDPKPKSTKSKSDDVDTTGNTTPSAPEGPRASDGF